eukprot:8340723-Pyramimonas_sp.AAC.1
MPRSPGSKGPRELPSAAGGAETPNERPFVVSDVTKQSLCHAALVFLSARQRSEGPPNGVVTTSCGESMGI